MPCVTAPSTCPSACIGLTAVPGSTAVARCSTLTWPVSVSTSTSANVAQNGGGLSVLKCDAPSMICSFSLYIACSAMSVIVTALRHSHTVNTSLLPYSSFSTGVSSIFDARLKTCARTFSAAFFTAPPEMMVVLEAYAPTSNGVMSVSPEVMTILSSVTPRLSAAICESTVSAPPPTSDAPTCR